ncbi:MAG: transcription antitermination factor NusB [Pseudomonadota bacterium]
MGGRRKSRELALQVLYQIDVSGECARDALDSFWHNFQGAIKSREFTEKLTEGACQHKGEIDSIIEKYSENWRLSRMSRVDRNILRLASFELFYCDDIPAKVTLNEAIDLGKKFGSEKSGSFINGILDRISAGIEKDRDDSRERD